MRLSELGNRESWSLLDKICLCIQGTIDLSKEEERINKQLTFKSQQINKLSETMDKPDYEDKVPKEVQEQNEAKLSALEAEVDLLGKALEAVKLMLTDQ
jgi:valyl-tRNA synthetase